MGTVNLLRRPHQFADVLFSLPIVVSRPVCGNRVHIGAHSGYAIPILPRIARQELGSDEPERAPIMPGLETKYDSYDTSPEQNYRGGSLGSSRP